MSMENIYKQLTNVDINEQMQIWDERGKGYYGEYLLFCELYKKVTGSGKVLMNLKIPSSGSYTTEIDLLLIHDTGLYVFEVKHYKGTIYGDDTGRVWTQYFVTRTNSTFNNPIAQNGYHMRALKNLFPNLPMRSLIVFTNDDCTVKVNNKNPQIDICALKDLDKVLDSRFKEQESKLTSEEIEKIFEQLSQYSPMQKSVEIDGKSASFYSWIKPSVDELAKAKEDYERIAEELKTEKQDLLKNYERHIKRHKEQNKQQKKQNRKVKEHVIRILIGIFCFLLGASAPEGFLESLANSGIHESDFGSGRYGLTDTARANNYFNIRGNVHEGLNSVTFSGSIELNSDKGIMLKNTSQYIVKTTSGESFKYDLFGSLREYNRERIIFVKDESPIITLRQIDFVDIKNRTDVAQIKLVGVSLISSDKKTVENENYEIVLYSKN